MLKTYSAEMKEGEIRLADDLYANLIEEIPHLSEISK